jgi:hypothetical protein
MSKRSKKKPENFLYLDCPDYPHCSGCGEFDTCDLCDDPVCWWEAVVAEDGLYCKGCAAMLELAYEEHGEGFATWTPAPPSARRQEVEHGEIETAQKLPGNP